MSDTGSSASARAIGLWRRTSFAVGDGPEDRTTTVFWGQTSRLYIDVRVPVRRPRCEAGTLARLADRDVRALGQQQGFAGDLVCVGDRFFSEIPVIDIAALAGNNASAIAATARPIGIEPATNDLSAAASSPGAPLEPLGEFFLVIRSVLVQARNPYLRADHFSGGGSKQWK